MINLGKTNIMISPLGLGIMQWGDIKVPARTDTIPDTVKDVYLTTINAGINFIDTAEIYGNGKSEKHLGRCINEISKNVIVASKFMPFPWRLAKGELKAALKKSLVRLGLDHIDLYQIHWPFPPISIKKWMEAMVDVFSEGLIRAVGVSNYSTSQTILAFDTLAKYKLPLVSNQVKFSLLDRRPERSGLFSLCQKLEIKIIAYSPLEKGILTGKYSPGNLPTDFRAWRYNRNYLLKIEPLLRALRDIGDAHAGMSPAKVALNWLICKGAVPIPGARNKLQAEENAGALGWHLNTEEVAELERISDLVNK